MTTTVLTSKFQTTIPKVVRQLLGLEINDTIEWKLEAGKAVIVPVRADFTANRGRIKVGAGDITADIEKARAAMVEQYR